jgi:hypothetical protein
LIEASRDLPSVRENAFAFEAGDAGIEIPGRRNGPGFFKRVVRIIEAEKGRETAFHGCSSSGGKSGIPRLLCIANGSEEARKQVDASGSRGCSKNVGGGKIAGERQHGT